MNSICQITCLAIVTVALLSGCSEPETTSQSVVDPATLVLHDFPSKTIELNGLQFRYIEHGEGPLIIFLHGFPYFADVWYKLIEEMGPDYHSVAMDNRGYGYSDKPEKVEDYHMEKLVEDVNALIKKMSAQGNAVLVGHDWGGALAWSVAQKYPQSVKKLVVVNAPPSNAYLNVLQKSQAQRDISGYIATLKNPITRFYLSFRGPDAL